MGLVWEPKEELEKELNKVYGSHTNGREWADVGDFSKELYEKHSIDVPSREIDENLDFNLSVYGELTFSGFEIILKKFHNHFNKDAVFYDLGSGFGKVISHASIRTDIKKSIGIEYDPKKAKKSKKMIERVKFPRSVPEVIQGDIFEQDLSDATVVYIDNTQFHPEFLKKLANEMLSKGCLFLYKHWGWMTGDRFFETETTYSKNVKYESEVTRHRRLYKFWYSQCSYRIIGERL